MRYKILDEAKVTHLGKERSAVDHVLQPAIRAMSLLQHQFQRIS
ncbi:MAG: hypothetical protein ACD_17C00545G0002 [uncultured bacterium]|nr:MAG: hypothetical protein ACD_17C00545G0002 [uncultured bacterium]